MAEKERILKEKVAYSGIFDLKGLYSYTHGWLDGEEEFDVSEDKYSEKVTGNTRAITAEWKATKSLSDYFKIEIKIEFEFSDISDVDVEVDGKKKRMNKGGVTVTLTGDLVKDPDSKWESPPFYKFLREVYNKYVIPARISNMEGRVSSTIVDLKENIKAFLEISGKR